MMMMVSVLFISIWGMDRAGCSRAAIVVRTSVPKSPMPMRALPATPFQPRRPI